MKINRMTSIKFLPNDRVLAAVEDSVNISTALADVAEKDRPTAQQVLENGEPLTIDRDFGPTRIRVRLVPVHARSRAAMNKENK